MPLRPGNIPTLSAVGTKILMIEDDWSYEARERGLTNPIRLRIDKFRKEERMFSGKPIPVYVTDETTQEEKEHYEQVCKTWYEQKNEYMAKRIFNEIGYDYFVKFAESKPEIAWMLNDEHFKACQSSNGQCSLYCLDYGECR